MRHHVVVIRPPYLQLLLSGKKRVECRLSRIRRPPFQTVSPGDLLWFKRPSGPILAMARAGRCRFHTLHDPDDLARLTAPYAAAIRAEADFFDGAETWARFLSLIWIDQILGLQPMRVIKSDKRAWVVLDAPPRPGMTIGSATRP